VYIYGLGARPKRPVRSAQIEVIRVPDRLAQCPHQTSLRSFADLDPYDAYDAAARVSAVAWDESFGGWVVLRYAECAYVLKEADTFPMPWNLLDGGHLALGKYGIFNLTGAPHEVMHKQLLDYFNPRKNKELQPLVRKLVAESLNRVAGRPSFDFLIDVAERVPGMMAFGFLGVPPDEDALRPIHEANHALQLYMQSYGDSAEAVEKLRAAHRMLEPYFGPTIEARRTVRENDLISLLWDFSDGHPDWGHEEMIAQCLFYFGASFGNTANALANAAYYLLSDASIYRELTERPERIAVFADEVLRAWAAVQFRIRVSTADVDRLILAVGAATRDDTVFPAPAELDPGRSNTRRHLTFGLGPRYCVGATLARLEAEELTRALIERYDTLTVTSGPPRFAGFNYRVFQPLTISTRP
jgi:cytochrome P450